MILLRDLGRRLPEWDAPVKLALALALALLLLLGALGFWGPREVRVPARVGGFGLLITLQVLFLYANRRDISPYHQAQECFVAGDYQAARAILEGIPETSRESVDALILLGNCYRHLGSFEKSAAALERSLQLKPDHHLALFSRGKLSLVLGEYGSAAANIARALDAGAPSIVRFELGQAHMLAGERELAVAQFRAVEPELADDPALALALRQYLHRLGERERPSVDMTRAGIFHWRGEAKKYAMTPYGEDLRLLLDELEFGLADE